MRGDRRAYRPIRSVLCDGSEPVAVARALLARAAAARLYVADLDALGGRAPQAATMAALLDALPGIELWLDAGFATPADFDRLALRIGAAAARVVPVFGSETLHSADALQEVGGRLRDTAVLSLDRRDGVRLDASAAWDSPAHWPCRVIVMTLERVGADAGPDLETLAALRARSASTQFFGAGGVRDGADLVAAHAAGATGWLVASALHDGRLPAAPR